MVKLSAIALLFAVGCSTASPHVRIFGAGGTERQSTPANLSSPLNPGNAGGIEASRTVADAVTFVELTPESRRWKAHTKLRASSSADEMSAEVGEAWLQWNATPWLDVTAGRVIEKWGSGYAWNPSSFIGPRKNPSDPNDRRSTYRGLDLVRVDLYARGATLSTYALEGGGVAARGSMFLAGTDVALSFARDGSGVQQGLSLARVFGDALELHAEAARRRVLIGGQYTFRGGANLVVEVHRSGDGLTEDAWRAFTSDVASASTAESFRDVNARYKPLQMGRSYGFMRLYVPWHARRADFELIAIPSLRDGSAIVRASATRELLRNLDAYVIDTEFTGGRDTEFAYMQVRRVTAAGLRYHF